MRVAIFDGKSQYNVLNSATREIAQAFAAAGHAAVVIQLQPGVTLGDLCNYVQSMGRFDMAFSLFGRLGECTDELGRGVGDLLHLPLVLHYVDSPLLPESQMCIGKTSANAALLFVDRSHVRDVQVLFGADRFAYAGFSPHAALGEMHPLPADAGAFMAARPIRFLFAGSYNECNALPWRNGSEALQKLMADTADLALSRDWIPIREAFDQVLLSRGIDPTDRESYPHLGDARPIICARVEEWIRHRKRQDFLDMSARLGMPLTVYGKGFETALDKYPNIDYRGSADMTEILRVMGQTQIVLNVNPYFGEGSHERPLTAMLAGAAVATDTSAFYEDNFISGRNIILYKRREIEIGLQNVLALSGDAEALYRMAKAGQRAVMIGHRWDNRIDTYIKAAQLSAARMAA